MDYWHALQLKALKAVLYPDRDYTLRRIHRWYSKTFFTPLEQVYDLPEEEVLLAYFEDNFEELSSNPEREQELESLKFRLTETEEETARRLKNEDSIADDADSFAALVAAEEKARLEAKGQNQNPITSAIPQRSEILPADPADPPRMAARASGLPSTKTLPEEISFTFVPETDPDFDEWLDSPGLMGGPPKKQSSK